MLYSILHEYSKEIPMGIKLKNGMKLTAIIVDDEIEIRETLKIFLEMMGVFSNISIASDGLDAI